MTGGGSGIPSPSVKALKDLRQTFALGLCIGAFFGLGSGVGWGKSLQRAEFRRVGADTEQAQRRHEARLLQGEERLDFIVECSKRADHLDDSSDKLAFCERQVNRW